MPTIAVQVLLLWTILCCIPLVSCQLLDKKGCNVTSSCYSQTSGCLTSDDCEYLLKYSVDDQNITFELSSNQYEWVAVGFNSKDSKGGMAGGKSLACESHGASGIRLNYYDMPAATKPNLISETKATLLSSARSGRVLYCKFSRKLNLGTDRYSLVNPVYLLYAAGYMKKDEIEHHMLALHSSNPVSVSVITDNSDRSKARKRIDTSSCGKNTSCLRDPKDCKDNTDCKYLAVFKKSGSNIEFSISGQSEGWISVGFNSKAQMGNTDAVICQRNRQRAALWRASLEYSSPTLEKPNETSLLEGIFEGGVIYCKFSRPLKPKSSKMLDISVARYVIFGKGAGVSAKISKHHGSGSKGCSNKKVDFTASETYELGNCHGDDLSKVHGSFMIFAWMFLVVISVFIARYSRSLWGGKTIFGKDAWFQVHRLIMGLAVLLTVVSIIIIFVHKEGWSEAAGDHAVFGIVVLVLAIVQPTIAFFRPHPTSIRRPVFNWIHRIIALAVVILAVLSVFKGADLLEEDGGDVAAKILIVLLVIAIITALILEFLAFRIRKQSADYHVGLSHGKMEVSESPVNLLWEVKVQRVLLALLFVVVLMLVVAMIAFVAGAGEDDDDDAHDNHHR